jgi:hypothetical protein
MNRETRERLKAQAQAAKPVPAIQPTTSPVVPGLESRTINVTTDAPSKKAANLAAGPTLTYSCGHQKLIEKITARVCPACNDAALAQARKAKKERNIANRAAKTPGAPKHTEGRLPDGADFRVIYDANTQTWTGTLTIDGMEPFMDTASGVFRLLSNLDAQYRAAIAPKTESAVDFPQ